MVEEKSHKFRKLTIEITNEDMEALNIIASNLHMGTKKLLREVVHEFLDDQGYRPAVDRKHLLQ